VLCCASGAPREISRFVLPSFIRVAAISSHFGLACGSTGAAVLFFDLGSDFLARQAPLAHSLVGLEFDEANGFVIAAGARTIAALAFDGRTVAELDLGAALSCQPATVWFTSPLLATGHSDGTARLWQIDTADWTFREVACFGGLRQPLPAVHLFARCQALLMIEAAQVASADAKFFHVGLFAKCAVCEAAVRQGSAVLCKNCGLAVCKECVAAKRRIRCGPCVQAEVEAPSPAAEEEEVEERITLAD
jgi:hypothetical protein